MNTYFTEVIRKMKRGFQFITDPIYRESKNQEYAAKREYRRIKSLPRHTASETYLLGKRLIFLDKSAFTMYTSVFGRESYRFPSSKTSPVIIDCGANIGLCVIYFKQLYPDSTVIAFEADPSTFQALRENVSNFELTNVKLIPKAVWSCEARLPFYLKGGISSRIALEADTENITQVDATSLRPYLNSPVDFLKMNIEGAEYEVLESCKDLLGNVQNIFVDYHSAPGRDQRLGDLLRMFTDAGFRYYLETPGIQRARPYDPVVGGTEWESHVSIFGYKAGHRGE